MDGQAWHLERHMPSLREDTDAKKLLHGLPAFDCGQKLFLLPFL